MPDHILVAMLDSGLTAAHPHLAGVAVRGFGLEGCSAPLVRVPDFTDRTGHGTACTAALVRLAPPVEVLAVRLLDDELRTTSAALAAGIVAAAEAGARIINLSLGSRSRASAEPLARAVEAATSLGAVCVAAAHPRGADLWPADLEHVLSASTHRSCPLADLYRVEGPLPRYVTHGWPRTIEGRRPTDNLFGPSIAAVHLTARVASLLTSDPALSFGEIVQRLDATCAGPWRPS